MTRHDHRPRLDLRRRLKRNMRPSLDVEPFGGAPRYEGLDAAGLDAALTATLALGYGVRFTKRVGWGGRSEVVVGVYSGPRKVAEGVGPTASSALEDVLPEEVERFLTRNPEEEL